MKNALKLGVAVALVVATYEVFSKKGLLGTETWGDSAKQVLTSPVTYAAGAAAFVAGIVLVR